MERDKRETLDSEIYFNWILLQYRQHVRFIQETRRD